MLRNSYDVIVVGGGPGGIPAAIAAARNGARTLLIERSAILGGQAVSGLPLLGFIDRQGNKVLGGIAQEFIDELKKIPLGTTDHWLCPIHNSLTAVNAAWARIVFFDMVEKAGVDTLLYAELTDVFVRDGRVTGVRVLSRGIPYQFEAGIVIDATGDGCAIEKAGAAYEKGDAEGRMQPGSLTFNVGGVNKQAILDYIDAHPETLRLPNTYGMEQTHAQFFERVGFAFTGYAEFIAQARENGEFDLPRDRIIFTTMPTPGEFMVNTTRAVDVDMTDPVSVTAHEFDCHRQIRTLMHFFRKYCPGFENVYLASISPCLGGRESRRGVGRKTLTIEDVNALRITDDAIVLCGYNVDIHVPGSEKLSLQPVAHAVGIPYGCLVSDSVSGLLFSGRCISVDTEAFGLTRIMGTCMGVGEAAGTAAALAVRHGIAPDDVDVAELRRLLTANGAILEI